ncbi:lycopene cyclase domain-containing protein [Microbacterium oryzae]|uniref:lycopene cyclase domain-containing protein n=1 Tax=Microbacterium oryzae TaxID=743009 RepID=UPI0025AF8911|nr:lycopene cyclase domain-containing protein [Microbacterium oryzae]MDN3310087.1 lycopene cyclase domain-containing protein [Microbacterium oryzae]
MTYALLCAVFLGVAVVAAVALTVARRRGSRPPVRNVVLAALLAAAALLVLTAVFDNVMIAAGLFAYSDAHISGMRIGTAPVEDFTYPLAAAILLPALWLFLRRRHDS